MSSDKKQSEAEKAEKLKKRGSEKAMADHATNKHAPDRHATKRAVHGDPKRQEKREKQGKGRKDLRRAYEHLARVRVLLTQISGDPKLRAAAERLAALVIEDLRGEQASPGLAAELTRAAEHMAFAGLVTHEPTALPWSPDIEGALEDEYSKLRVEGQPRGGVGKSNGVRAEALITLHELMTETAEGALGRENYPCAMESVRAAEALASALELDASR